MQKVTWSPELRNALVLQIKDNDGAWVDFASIKDGEDARYAARYCRHGIEAFRFGCEIPASDCRVINARGEAVELLEA